MKWPPLNTDKETPYEQNEVHPSPVSGQTMLRRKAVLIDSLWEINALNIIQALLHWLQVPILNEANNLNSLSKDASVRFLHIYLVRKNLYFDFL